MKTCLYKEDFTNPDSNLHFHLYNTDYPIIHNHDYWEFFIILAGETDHFSNDRKQHFHANTGCLVHPADKHCFTNNSAHYKQLNICITDAYFKTLLDLIDTDLYGEICFINQPIVYNIDDETLTLINKNIHAAQLAHSTDPSKYSNFLKLIWLDIIKLIYRNYSLLNTKYPAWFNAFLQDMQLPENITRPTAELYKLTFFSYRHLTRLFKEFTGETLSEYQQRLKINYAATLLRTTDLSTLQIASTCGYDSLSHFIRIFKKYYNITPHHYKKSLS